MRYLLTNPYPWLPITSKSAPSLSTMLQITSLASPFPTTVSTLISCRHTKQWKLSFLRCWALTDVNYQSDTCTVEVFANHFCPLHYPCRQFLVIFLYVGQNVTGEYITCYQMYSREVNEKENIKKNLLRGKNCEWRNLFHPKKRRQEVGTGHVGERWCIGLGWEPVVEAPRQGGEYLLSSLSTTATTILISLTSFQSACLVEIPFHQKATNKELSY